MSAAQGALYKVAVISVTFIIVYNVTDSRAGDNGYGNLAQSYLCCRRGFCAWCLTS